MFIDISNRPAKLYGAHEIEDTIHRFEEAKAEKKKITFSYYHSQNEQNCNINGYTILQK